MKPRARDHFPRHAGQLCYLQAVTAVGRPLLHRMQVAQLAGVPREVITRARQFLVGLENQRDRRRPVSPQGELPLLAPAEPLVTPEDEAARALAAAVQELNPDELSPKAALEALYRLRSLLKP